MDYQVRVSHGLSGTSEPWIIRYKVDCLRSVLSQLAYMNSVCFVSPLVTVKVHNVYV